MTPTKRQLEILAAIKRRLSELQELDKRLPGDGRSRYAAVGTATAQEIHTATISGAVRCNYESLFKRSPTRSESVMFSRDVKRLEAGGLIERICAGESRRATYLRLVH